jgi:hypothetical protein
MVRLILLLVLGIRFFGMDSQASAQPKYGPAGCGLGSLVFDPKPGFMQIFAMTTNGTGSQPSGITSGTSNCDATPDVWVQNEQEQFITANLASIAVEASQGGGPTIVGFAQVFGCPADMNGHFANTLRSGYGKIFKAPGAMAVLDATVVELKADPILSSECQKII